MSAKIALSRRMEPLQTEADRNSGFKHYTLGTFMRLTLPEIPSSLLRGAEFCMAILQQILVFGQKSPLFQGDRPGLLFHPLLVRMPRDSRYADPARLQVDEEQHVVGDRALTIN